MTLKHSKQCSLIGLKWYIKAAKNCNLFRLQFELTTQNNSEKKINKMKNFVPVLAILVAVLVLRFQCQEFLNVKVLRIPIMSELFSNKMAENEILEICTKDTDVKLKTTADIFCMLDPKQPLCRQEQCVLECITGLQNMTIEGVLSSNDMIMTHRDRGQAKFKAPEIDENARRIEFLVRKCSEAANKVLESKSRDNVDKCLLAYEGLKCMRNHPWADVFVAPNSCP